jgi:hypothetical protein
MMIGRRFLNPILAPAPTPTILCLVEGLWPAAPAVARTSEIIIIIVEHPEL